jgi:NAD(P)-dependent dehydrogenase (short-subunit alcohol dehydrogenase family)
MDLKLQNKPALVSGSTTGIGLTIAQTLAQEGALSFSHDQYSRQLFFNG